MTSDAPLTSADATKSAPVSVIIPTFRRVEALRVTLRSILDCRPAPAETLVMVDFGDDETIPSLAAEFPGATFFQAETRLGPGGARNLLAAKAAHDVIASFDDDSFPIDPDYFATVSRIMDQHPRVAVLAAQIVHDGEETPEQRDALGDGADFVGCGCAFRRSAFLATRGYVPLKLAYGAEEADLALQLLDADWRIVEAGALRVRHATNRGHQDSPDIVAAHIANTALLAFLRYPARLWPYGVAQVLNRVRYSLSRRHVRGVLSGLVAIPSRLWENRAFRAPVRSSTIRQMRTLRRAPRLS